jgi:glycosyltransferase involved in cell wall biosynthesis
LITKLNVYKAGSGDGISFTDFVSIKLAELKILKIERIDHLYLYVFSSSAVTSKFFTLLFCFIFSRHFFMVDNKNQTSKKITFLYLLKEFGIFLVDIFIGTITKFYFEIYVRFLKFFYIKANSSGVDTINKCLYIRAPLWFGLEAGGSIAHSAGVINSMRKLFKVDVFTTDYIQMVSGKQELFKLPRLLWNSRMALHFWTSLSFYKQIPKERYSFIYQRYSAFDMTGLLISLKQNIPLILEYNGSEIWIAENWGKAYSHRKVGLIVEAMCLKQAHKIVVVSEALKKELINRGIECDKIIVYPNGVDINFYKNLELIESEKSLDFSFDDNDFYFGFVGTFGKWHGVPLLVKAFERFLQKNREKTLSCKLILIGSGPESTEVKKLSNESEFSSRIIITGAIPQAITPSYLKNCNVLIAPTLKNDDGSEFIGSPTKIFEYMALGKIIICSPLGQINSIITNGKNGITFTPNSVESLSNALTKAYFNFEDLKNLGDQAFYDVSKKYTWDIHVEKIIKNL